MALTAAQYTEQLLALAPSGSALPSGDTDSTWYNLVAALALGLARLDERADDLVDEADPRSALELLEDWERVCGLPDACTGDATTIQERRARVVATLTATGGQSRAYFAVIAATLGYTVEIKEFRPFIAGQSCCGDLLNGGASVRNFWRLRVPGPRVTWFRAGASQCGDTLGAISRAEDLECILERLKPAQTQLIVAYEEA